MGYPAFSEAILERQLWLRAVAIALAASMPS
jgi:hypothetical protein